MYEGDSALLERRAQMRESFDRVVTAYTSWMMEWNSAQDRALILRRYQERKLTKKSPLNGLTDTQREMVRYASGLRNGDLGAVVQAMAQDERFSGHPHLSFDQTTLTEHPRPLMQTYLELARGVYATEGLAHHNEVSTR